MRNKGWKRVITLLLAVTLLFTSVPVNAETLSGSTAYGLEYEVITADDGSKSIAITGYAGVATAVNIPAEIDGVPVTSIGESAFRNCSSLTNIKIPEGVTGIGWEAFRNCSSLTSIMIPESVTSIGWEAFWDCSSLANIKIPKSVTSIKSDAFNGCSGLESIIVDDGNGTYNSAGGCNAIIETATNTLICGCKNTTIPEGVTRIGEFAFANCSSLVSIVIPESVTLIEWYAFCNCSSLTNITIPKSVTRIGEFAFGNCNCLTDVYYTGNKEQWNQIALEGHNRDLTDATIHYNFTVTNYKKEAQQVTEYIRAIGKVTLDSKAAIDKARAAYNALSEYAKQLVSSTDLKILTDAEATYARLKQEQEAADTKKTVKVGDKYQKDNVTYVVAKKNTVVYQKNKNKKATSVKIPSTVKINGKKYTVIEVDANAFKNNKKLKKVTIPKTVKKIDKNAFQNCTALTSVSIGAGVTVIQDGAFAGCSKITRVTIPAKVTQIGTKAFYNCKKLKSIDIKSTSLKKINKSAYKGIAKNAKIKVPKKKLAAYKKLLKKSGLSSKVKIVK